MVLEGDELVRQDHGQRNSFDIIGQNRPLFRVLIYIYDDGCFAVRPSGANACVTDRITDRARAEKFWR